MRHQNQNQIQKLQQQQQKYTTSQPAIQPSNPWSCDYEKKKKIETQKILSFLIIFFAVITTAVAVAIAIAIAAACCCYAVNLVNIVVIVAAAGLFGC